MVVGRLSTLTKGKVLPFKKGGQKEAPLGLVCYEDTADPLDRIKYDPDISKFILFRMVKSIKFSNKLPYYANRSDLHIHKSRESEFINYSWEFELLDLIYSINTRPFNNKDLKKIIPKLRRISKDTRDVIEILAPQIDHTRNTKPKRSFGDMRPQSIDEIIKEMGNWYPLTDTLTALGEADMKLKKTNRSPTVLSILYPVQILTKIYNCLDRDKTFKDFKTFIHQEIVNLSSLKDLDYITIENAIKQARKNSFQFQDLLNARSNEELNRIWNFILSK